MTKSEKDKGTGYKKPPKETQWKKGQSGNPKGRPKKSAKKDDLEKGIEEILKEELNETLLMNTALGSQEISIKRAIAKRLIEKCLKDKDTRAIDRVLKIIKEMEEDNLDDDDTGVTIIFQQYPDDENSNRRASDIIE